MPDTILVELGNTPLPFQAHQLAFTQWIRHPNTTGLPEGISAKRMHTYRDLIFNNISSFIEHTYPVTQAMLPSDLWHALIMVFFQYGQCDSPFYYDISLHFREFLEQDLMALPVLNDAHALESLQNIHHDFPWLRELMHYEWMGLYVDIADVSWGIDKNPTSELLATTSLKLKTTCWILAYQYAVHTWSVDTQPADPQISPSCLLVLRDKNDQTQVYPLHPLWAFLLEHIQNADHITSQELIDLIEQAAQLSSTAAQDVVKNMLHWLQAIDLLKL